MDIDKDINIPGYPASYILDIYSGFSANIIYFPFFDKSLIIYLLEQILKANE